jgi:hypothetical protein
LVFGGRSSTRELPPELTDLEICAKLSDWIYGRDPIAGEAGGNRQHPSEEDVPPGLRLVNMHAAKDSQGGNGFVQWAVLQSVSEPFAVFVAFRGTEHMLDWTVNMSIIPVGEIRRLYHSSLIPYIRT